MSVERKIWNKIQFREPFHECHLRFWSFIPITTREESIVESRLIPGRLVQVIYEFRTLKNIALMIFLEKCFEQWRITLSSWISTVTDICDKKWRQIESFFIYLHNDRQQTLRVTFHFSYRSVLFYKTLMSYLHFFFIIVSHLKLSSNCPSKHKLCISWIKARLPFFVLHFSSLYQLFDSGEPCNERFPTTWQCQRISSL